MVQRFGQQSCPGVGLAEQAMSKALDGGVTQFLRGGETGLPGRQLLVKVAASPQVTMQGPGELPDALVPAQPRGRRLGGDETRVLLVEPLQDRCVVGETRDLEAGRRLADLDLVAVRIEQAFSGVARVDVV